MKIGSTQQQLDALDRAIPGPDKPTRDKTIPLLPPGWKFVSLEPDEKSDAVIATFEIPDQIVTAEP